MTAKHKLGKLLKFEIPSDVRLRYMEPEAEDLEIDIIDFDPSATLGPVGKMIKEHKKLVLNCVNYSELLKPFVDWSGTTKEAFVKQRMSFNSRLDKMGDIRGVLLGGEEVILKRGRFILSDITHERQELARIMRIVTEVLFFEAVVYCPDTLRYMQVEDYQIKRLFVDK